MPAACRNHQPLAPTTASPPSHHKRSCPTTPSSNHASRILGISGLVRGLVQGSWEAWRVASVVGLLAGGALLHYALPGAFEAFPAAYTLPRATVAGLLVGLGTSRGSGCTSGHGICGNSRLSLRSFAATCTFMASGAVAAHLAGTAAVFGLPQGLAPLAPALPLSPTARFGVALLATATAIAGVLALTGRRLVARTRSATMLEAEQQEASAVEKAPLAGTPPPARADAQKLAALSTATDLLTSLGFALALGVSSMLKPSKVAGERSREAFVLCRSVEAALRLLHALLPCRPPRNPLPWALCRLPVGAERQLGPQPHVRHGRRPPRLPARLPVAPVAPRRSPRQHLLRAAHQDGRGSQPAAGLRPLWRRLG